MGRLGPKRLLILLGIALSVVVVAGACGSRSTPFAEYSPTVTDVDEALSEAIEFRSRFGLRADRSFVESVARDPSASSDPFGVPLLHDEIEQLLKRASTIEAIEPIVRAEALAHAGEFGGMFVDPSSGQIVTLWTAAVEKHALAIRTQVDPRIDIVFRRVRFSEKDLDALQGRIVTDADWMQQVPARLISASVNAQDNRVDLFVSSTNLATSGLIVEHYGTPPGMLAVEIDGTGAALLPWGLVQGTVIGPNGKAPEAGDLELRWTSANATYCGVGDRGFPVVDGQFSLPCQAGTWTISVVRLGASTWEEVGRAVAVVPADGVVEIQIAVTTD